MIAFFLLASYMGEVEGYILVITFIYMLYDKKLAFQLSLIALISMSINHLLKSIIGFQRPFVKEGTFLENWLVSKENALELVSENSTPSGHAMSSSAFYGFLAATTKSKLAMIIFLAIILLVGASRPYLAVHFIEDILLGWLFGLLLVVVVLKQSSKLSELWNNLSLLKKALLILLGSLFLWVSTFYINGGHIANQPLPFVGYLGFLMGVCIGYELEQVHINFNPKSKSWPLKIIRWLLTIVLVMIPVIILDELFADIWTEPTFWSHLLQYVGYTLAGFLGIFVAPYLCSKFKLVDIRLHN